MAFELQHTDEGEARSKPNDMPVKKKHRDLQLAGVLLSIVCSIFALILLTPSRMRSSAIFSFLGVASALLGMAHVTILRSSEASFIVKHPDSEILFSTVDPCNPERVLAAL